jgi:hypothetical protein
MDNEIRQAAAELDELNGLLSDLSRQPTRDVIEIITQNTPGYIEAARASGELPEKTIDLVVDYGIWNLFRLHRRYEKVWDEALEHHYLSASAPGGAQMVKTIWAHVAMVIGERKD